MLVCSIKHLIKDNSITLDEKVKNITNNLKKTLNSTVSLTNNLQPLDKKKN